MRDDVDSKSVDFVNLGFLGCRIFVFMRFSEKAFYNCDFHEGFRSVSKIFLGFYVPF